MIGRRAQAKVRVRNPNFSLTDPRGEGAEFVMRDVEGEVAYLSVSQDDLVVWLTLDDGTVARARSCDVVVQPRKGK